MGVHVCYIAVRLELATRDASIVMGQSLLWDKSYPKVYGITNICLPSLQLATPLTRAQVHNEHQILLLHHGHHYDMTMTIPYHDMYSCVMYMMDFVNLLIIH